MNSRFNGHPPLGVNATAEAQFAEAKAFCAFQWAPTLGGECYSDELAALRDYKLAGFNGHPPLGVNATV